MGPPTETGMGDGRGEDKSIHVWPLLSAVLLALLVGVLLEGLGKELSYDEAYTLLCYVHTGFGYALTHYHAPNNHVLYSVLLSLIRPEGVEPLYRAVSVLAALATVALCVKTTRKLAPGRPPRVYWALVTASVLGLPVFLSFATQIRGYALSMACCAVMLASRCGVLGGRLRSGVAYTLAGAVAIGIMPTNVLLVLCFALADLIKTFGGDRASRPRFSETFLLHLLACCGFLTYLSLGTQMAATLNKGWGWSSWTALLPALLVGTLPAAATVCGGVAAGSRRTFWRATRASLLPVAPFLSGFAVLLVALVAFRVRLFPRTFVAFLPLLVVTLGVLAVGALGERRRHLAWTILATALAGLLWWHASVYWLMRDGARPAAALVLPEYYEARDFDPFETVAAAEALLRQAPSGVIVFDNSSEEYDPMAFWYYALQRGLERRMVFSSDLPRDPHALAMNFARGVVVAIGPQGRDLTAARLRLGRDRLALVKGSGHYKLWWFER